MAAHSSTDIQSHLYLSLLKGYTADVALHAKGADWEVIYHLHRVVLIQAVGTSLSTGINLIDILTDRASLIPYSQLDFGKQHIEMLAERQPLMKFMYISTT